MLNLFTGKISGVLSLTLQGISKAVGLVLNTVFGYCRQRIRDRK
ncbi:hypothetical protein [Acinetobacter sp. YH12219]|nr:hypothetical protein [Acinetobacter sp. YH12219]